MDSYQLAASIVQSVASLAWPAVVLIAILAFKEKLTSLLPFARLKYKDLELRFQDAEKEAEKLPETSATTDIEPTPEEITKFERMAKLAPRGAMLEVRANLEAAVREYAQMRGLSNIKPYTSYSLLIRQLRQNDLIDRNTSALLDDLRAIGNAAAHNQSDPTEQDALRYQELSERLIKQFNILSGAGQKPPPESITKG